MLLSECVKDVQQILRIYVVEVEATMVICPLLNITFMEIAASDEYILFVLR